MIKESDSKETLNLARWNEWSQCKGEVISKPVNFNPDINDNTTHPAPYSVQRVEGKEDSWVDSTGTQQTDSRLWH